MKKTLLLLSFIFIASFVRITADTIPNSGFELWSSLIWFEEPTNWTTNNSELLPPGVFKDSASHSGFIAMGMTNYAFVPYARSNFHINTHPSNFGGYVKNTLSSNDSAVIVVYIFYQQQLVDSGHASIMGGINPAFSPFMIPISQNSSFADSCEITIYGGSALQSTVSFDDAQFDISLGVPDIHSAGLKVFPNPCTDFILVNSDNGGLIELYNLSGQKINLKTDFFKTSIATGNRNTRIDLSGLSAGAYVITLNNNKGRYSTLVLKQ